MRLIVMTAAAMPPCPVTPQTKAEVFSGQAVQSQLTALIQAAKASGGSGATLGDYQSHAIKLSVRTASGGAEVHAHYDDIFFVTEGKATLVTGGNVINGKTDSEGETKGSSIQNGKSEIIAKGRRRSHPGRHAASVDPGSRQRL